MAEHFPENVFKHNPETWVRWAEMGCEWTIPASPEMIAAVRRGEWQVVLINFYEDYSRNDPVKEYLLSYFATRAVKL